MRTYRIDIDGTIALPLFYSEDFQECVDWYVREGVVKPEEIASLQFHQQLFLLPHVLITHRAIDGAIQVLQELNTQGTLEYFTVRQSLDKEVCRQVHENTRIWLEQQHFPRPTDVRFFWDAGEKLLASLEAQEEEVFLIDDRAEGLTKAYAKIVQNDPENAEEIRQRVTLAAFGRADINGLPGSDLRVVPLPDWSTFRQLISQ